MLEWLLSMKIDCALVVDEAQHVFETARDSGDSATGGRSSEGVADQVQSADGTTFAPDNAMQIHRKREEFRRVLCEW